MTIWWNRWCLYFLDFWSVSWRVPILCPSWWCLSAPFLKKRVPSLLQIVKVLPPSLLCFCRCFSWIFHPRQVGRWDHQNPIHELQFVCNWTDNVPVCATGISHGLEADALFPKCHLFYQPNQVSSSCWCNRARISTERQLLFFSLPYSTLYLKNAIFPLPSTGLQLLEKIFHSISRQSTLCHFPDSVQPTFYNRHAALSLYPRVDVVPFSFSMAHL